MKTLGLILSALAVISLTSQVEARTSLKWLDQQQASFSESEKVEAVKCDATHECPTGNTCCKTSSGQWGCCPLSQAVCCTDHVHCCPNGYTCDLTSGKCDKGLFSLPWADKRPAIVSEPKKVEAVQCDATHECPTGNTCCKTSSGQWGCCPLPQAVCCNDHVHCCPHDTTCDVSSGKCNRGLYSVPWLNKQPAIASEPKKVEAVRCDATHECSTGNTCCKTSSGQWGCCPLPQAVCCSDHVHCCPNGYTCDVSSGKCNKGFHSLPWLNKQLVTVSVPKKVEAVMCDATHECPTGNTCCKTSSGQWGCCPLPQAVCCSDHVHCCPNGYTCDVSSGKCNKGFHSLPWLSKQPVTVSEPKKVEAVKCDATHECPTGNTCCKTSSGQWGCCPLPQAVCCSDHVHCCPHDTTCEVSTGKCNRGLYSVPWLNKQPAIVSEPKRVEAVQCDSTHECPDGNTCCKLPSGQWGCCPIPDAVCCSDHIHCCPHGTMCDVSTGKCNRGLYSVPWLNKQPAIVSEPKRVEAVLCDATHECPDGNTCCKLPSGQWGCCPIPDAVCCSDHIHCCPHGTMCDVSTGKCNRGLYSVPWLNKQPAIVSEPKRVEAVLCDATHECPDGNTCCKLPSGQWGCCPIPDAVCCSDHIHCCPHGTMCDVSTGKCNRGLYSVPWLNKQPAIVSEPKRVEDVQCDATHACPDGNTCCKLPSGQWGCCPIPQAVCCSDHIHCCPHGTTCDVSTGKCNRGLYSVPWLNKQPAIVSEPKRVEDVQCDATHACPDGNTCCKLPSGQWGCCPIPQAVCCSDHIHCCPQGYTCNVSTGTCNKGLHSVFWLSKQTANVRCGRPYSFAARTDSMTLSCQ